MNEEHITKLQINQKEIILLGTAHVSKESAVEVRELIELERPDSVCVELDEGRYQSIMNPKKWENTDVIEVIKKKQAFLLLANIILSAYQKRMAKKFDTVVGKEMTTAIDCAKEFNAKLILADRDIQTTFKRIWRKHSFSEKFKILTALLLSENADENIEEEDIEKLKNGDMLEEALKEISETFPIVYEVLVEERNYYLAKKIRNAPGMKVVAVLGAAHVPGIKEELLNPRILEGIDKVPQKTTAQKMSGWIIPLIIIGAIIYSFIHNNDLGITQIKSWILYNGGFSAFGCLLCLAHPLTILTAFIAAPITSLNPLLAAGWFAGIVEAMIRKPKVQDLQNVYQDISSLKGIYRNRMIRILLIVIMANLFSTIATVISSWDIFSRLLSF